MLLDFLLDCTITVEQFYSDLCDLWPLLVVNLWGLFLFLQLPTLSRSDCYSTLLTGWFIPEVVGSRRIFWWFLFLSIQGEVWRFLELFCLWNPLGSRKFVLFIILLIWALFWDFWYVIDGRLILWCFLNFWLLILNNRIGPQWKVIFNEIDYSDYFICL